MVETIERLKLLKNQVGKWIWLKIERIFEDTRGNLDEGEVTTKRDDGQVEFALLLDNVYITKKTPQKIKFLGGKSKDGQAILIPASYQGHHLYQLRVSAGIKIRNIVEVRTENGEVFSFTPEDRAIIFVSSGEGNLYEQYRRLPEYHTDPQIRRIAELYKDQKEVPKPGHWYYDDEKLGFRLDLDKLIDCEHCQALW